MDTGRGKCIDFYAYSRYFIIANFDLRKNAKTIRSIFGSLNKEVKVPTSSNIPSLNLQRKVGAELNIQTVRTNAKVSFF